MGQGLTVVAIGIAAVVGVVMAAAAIFVIVMVILFFVGGPDLSANCSGRALDLSRSGQAFDDLWDDFNLRIDAGQTELITIDEGLATSRARSFLVDEEVGEIRDVTICLNGPDVNEARGKVEIAVLPDVTAVLTGDIDINGSHPVITITDIEVGSLPGFVADLVDGPIEAAVNEALEDIELRHRYALQTGAGGSPASRGRP